MNFLANPIAIDVFYACIYMCVYIYIYIYIYMFVHVYSIRIHLSLCNPTSTAVKPLTCCGVIEINLFFLKRFTKYF